MPEEFLRWHLVLNEQMKNHGYSGSYYMVMNLAQSMSTGRSLEAFLNERWTQETKKQNTQGEGSNRVHSRKKYDCAIFVLAIRAFDIQSGWRDAYDRQREYMRKDIFIGKLKQKNSLKDCKI
jgi:hypothetical protein